MNFKCILLSNNIAIFIPHYSLWAFNEYYKPFKYLKNRRRNTYYLSFYLIFIFMKTFRKTSSNNSFVGYPILTFPTHYLIIQEYTHTRFVSATEVNNWLEARLRRHFRET